MRMNVYPEIEKIAEMNAEMKSVLLSVNSHWCSMILNGEKTLEVRKTRPKIETPFKCYIYCTKLGPYLVIGDKMVGDGYMEKKYCTTYGYSREEADRIWGVMNGKVICEFTCDKIERCGIPYPAYQKELPDRFVKESCVMYYDLHEYARHDDLYFWHITTLKIYDDPRKLSEFSSGSSRFEISDTEDGLCSKRRRMERPPQSWCYVHDEKGAQE